MTSRFALLLSACLLASCTTVATKKRPPYKPTPVTTTTKKPKSMAGMTAGRPPEQIQSETLTLPEPPKTEDALEYLRVLVNKSVQSPTKAEQDANRLHAIDIVENKLNEDQLEDVADSSDFGFLRAHAMYRLGELALDRKDTSAAKKYFAAVEDFVPGTDQAIRAQEMIQQLDASKNVHTETVGVVLPLSGRNAPVGQRALRGLEMGLGLHIPGSGFKLAVMDSEGNPDSARRGVERLVKEDNVIAIVGSLLSKTAPAVAAKSDELGVPTVALSQRSGLTEIGPTVFRNSLTSGMQVRALVRTAMDDLGMKKFAVLYPNDAYGVEFANIFWDEVLARGGQITAVQNYSTKETDFRLVIQRLVGTYFGEARQDEFNLRMKELQHSDKKRSVRQSNLENILPPITDFDAIFIPDSVKAMGQISAMLSYNDVKNVKLMGTNLWNTKDVARRAGNFSNNLLFVDSLTPTAQDKSRFVAEYKSLYNEDPSLIEVQAYDAGLILRQLIVAGADSREELTQKLSQLSRFPGALGPLSMNAEREIERPVTALTIEKGEVIPFKSGVK
ncbi:branched-chain amino acid ABC transporter substrate-binding protein [Bdellovibrio bacteriovorus]|uniref:Branched-chain amino acid ABC transporter substrate-binding protein n=1 Tax=Bdellovibrio bacteriovorus TaxID=959 RepID=A0A161PU49_BDEBC|nr:penicillin-binding protein activator [Bdellovibrio bacteriovorus]KYG68938.1 branched-chain amino acid ABC transporter substrate-binding protein [Bdellovibrio bacteriovorus]